MLKILPFFLVLIALAEEQPYTKIIHNTLPQAKCLDGTSPALYIHQGIQKDKILIFFVGGGYCSGSNTQQVLQSCYQRMNTDLGSSKNLPDQLISPGGYLSTDPTLNKFATWIKIIILYCDGAQHQGFNKDSIKYKDKQIYFRGSENTRSHIAYIQKKYSLAKANKVLFTGASAGGIATLMWSNYIRSRVSNPNNVYVIADSAIFVNTSSPKTGRFNVDIVSQNLFKVSNIDEKVPINECNIKYPNQQYKCVLIQNYYQFLNGKVMFINSQYDEVGIELALDTKCLKRGVSGYTLKYCSPKQIQEIQAYRKEYLNIVNTFMAYQKHSHSIWTIGCCQHSYACYQNFFNVQSQKIPAKVGKTVAQSIYSFVFDDKIIRQIDDQQWPFNEPCAF